MWFLFATNWITRSFHYTPFSVLLVLPPFPLHAHSTPYNFDYLYTPIPLHALWTFPVGGSEESQFYFIACSKWCPFTFTHARNCFFHWSTASSIALWYDFPCSMRNCFKSLHFRRSCLKANKVSKSVTRKVAYAYNFGHAVCWRCLPKIIKISPCLSKLQLAKVGSFLRHGAYNCLCTTKGWRCNFHVLLSRCLAGIRRPSCEALQLQRQTYLWLPEYALGDLTH